LYHPHIDDYLVRHRADYTVSVRVVKVYFSLRALPEKDHRDPMLAILAVGCRVQNHRADVDATLVQLEKIQAIDGTLCPVQIFLVVKHKINVKYPKK
jgi:hypothetical protein